MSASGVRGWRIRDDIAERVKDYARIKGLSDQDAATYLFEKALIAEMEADPALRAAMDAILEARKRSQ